MPRTLTAAAVRLSNDPAPTDERLHTAELQVIKAARQGAQLVVLPEVFNTGYIYSDDNYRRAEPIEGPTVSWMKRITAEHHIHLAGTLMLLGPEHITNSLILAAPDGRLWRYDKNYPWVWERVYFREGRDITVAETDIGTFGLMICADVTSTQLFERYAGKIDALIISSSPPRAHEIVFHFPDGARISLASLLGMTEVQCARADRVFGEHVLESAAWLGVPVIHAVPYGQFSTHIPAPYVSFGITLARKPSLWNYLWQGRDAIATARYFNDNQIADADGNVLARYDADADGFAFAEITLPDSPAQPTGKPPRARVFPADIYSWLLVPYYRRGIRRALGQQMAPEDRHTQVWRSLLFTVGLLGYFIGRSGRQKRKHHRK